MKIIGRIGLIAACLWCGLPLWGRQKVGEWRDHYTYLSAMSLCLWNDGLAVLSPEGIMTYSLEDGKLNLISSMNGLSDKGLVSMTADAQTQSLILGYAGGGIDVLWNDKIFPIKDIKNSALTGTSLKGVYAASAVYAYGDFGIALVDVLRREVKDNFRVGDPLNPPAVLGIQEYGGRLYVAASDGLYSIEAGSRLMSDPAAWTKEYSGNRVVAILSSSNAFYAAIEQNGGTSTLIRKYSAGVWTDFYSSEVTCKGLSETNEAVWIMSVGKMQRIYKNTGQLLNEWTTYDKNWQGFQPSQIIEKNSRRWIADAQLGLIVWNSGFERVRPARSDVLNVLSEDAGAGSLWLAGKGLYARWSSDLWTNVYATPMKNALCLRKDPRNDSGFSVGTSDGKVIHWDGTAWDSVKIGNGAISSLAYDAYGNVWGTRSAADGPIFVERNKSFLKLSITALTNKSASKMICDTYGIIWALIPNVGVLALRSGDGNTGALPTEDKLRYRLVSAAEMGISGYKILSMDTDRDGILWLGTTGGVFAVYNASNVFNGTISANRIMVKTEIEGQGAYLLETESVKDVLVDGANRKWFATGGSGIYLQSENGVKSLLHFNPSNSPMPSSNVLNLCVEPLSGELFVFTDAGCLSYMPDASDAAADYSQAKVFPNPVRPEYSGEITLTGLKEKTKIRITDIAGDLCAQGTSNGGVWVWDGRTLKGKRPATGVYLIFLSDEAGRDSRVLKLLFVH